jgi:DHA1 family bicyclomycin/chloramphenicol resistance-like MFS transporter
VGPFSIDAYLPSFRDIGHAFHASPLLVQQTLTAYILPFSAMTLWQGPLSDAYGRRRVTLAMLAAFIVASVGCLCAWNITALLVFRVLQGLTAGAGMIVGRAMVRDLFDGADARRLMSRIAAVFAIAPAVAPILGGWLQVWFGWRSVFAFLTLFTTGLWFVCARALPETLPPERRHPLHPGSLLRGYGHALSSARFMTLALALTLNFSAIFVYIVSAPVFVLNFLHRGETEFYWLFGPVSVGMLAGTSLAGRLAGHWSNLRALALAYLVMGTAALGNFVMQWTTPPGLPWSVVPLAVYVLGTMLAMPSLTLMGLDRFPHRRGLAASCQGFVQTMCNAAITGLLAPLLWGSPRYLAGGMLLVFALGGASFLAYLALQRGKSHPPAMGESAGQPAPALQSQRS